MAQPPNKIWRYVIQNKNHQKIGDHINDPATDINAPITMENKLTILHVAISEKYDKTYTMVLKHHEVDVDCKDLFGKTPLQELGFS